MDAFKELFQKACAEGLIPFMMMQTNGTKSKRNTIRLIELLIIIAPLLIYGGKLISTLENVNKTQIAIQQEMKEMRTDNIKTRIELNTVTTRFNTFLDFEKRGEPIGE